MTVLAFIKIAGSFKTLNFSTSGAKFIVLISTVLNLAAIWYGLISII